MVLKTSPVVLFRRFDFTEDEELRSAEKYFTTTERRTLIPSGSLVIPRYSALPYYRELELDLAEAGSHLINTYEQHKFIADIRNWSDLLGDLAPRTYECRWDLLDEGSYIVKGTTNSRKHEWNKRMFAQTKSDVPRIVDNLMDDSLLNEQGIIVRDFIPLKTYAKGINDMPVTNEWRFFFLDGHIVDSGYYWSSFPEYEYEDAVESSVLRLDDGKYTAPDIQLSGRGDSMERAKSDLREALIAAGARAHAPHRAVACAQSAASLVRDRARFFVIDVAETERGEWIVIELNDGQMSGLSMIPPDRFYNNL